MRMTESPQRLVLQDAPGCFWLFGLFFIVAGGLALLASLGLSAQEVRLTAWQTILGVGMALLALATGVGFILRSPGSRVILDAQARTLTITRRGLLGRQVEQYTWDEISAVERIVTGDIDGSPVYSLVLHLHNGQDARVTHLWLHDPDGLARNVTAIQQFLA